MMCVSTGVLYICPTPIGNLEDITLRVLRILKEVDFIACEDTRVTQKLLNYYNIKVKLISYHKFSEKQKSEYLINLLKEGKNIALVSDAGTPLISDPGLELVKLAHAGNIKIVPLPGASAAMTAISAGCLEGSHFVFLGFLPSSKREKEDLLEKYKDINIIVYEAPSRFVETLQEIHDAIGNRTATVARELTKIYEEIKIDCLKNHIDYYRNHPPRGEITLVIKGEQASRGTVDEAEVSEKIRILKRAGYSTKEISKILALLMEFPKKQIYELVLKQDKNV